MTHKLDAYMSGELIKAQIALDQTGKTIEAAVTVLQLKGKITPELAEHFVSAKGTLQSLEAWIAHLNIKHFSTPESDTRS